MCNALFHNKQIVLLVNATIQNLLSLLLLTYCYDNSFRLVDDVITPK